MVGIYCKRKWSISIKITIPPIIFNCITRLQNTVLLSFEHFFVFVLFCFALFSLLEPSFTCLYVYKSFNFTQLNGCIHSDMMAHFNQNIWESEAGRSLKIQCHPGVYIELQEG